MANENEEPGLELPVPLARIEPQTCRMHIRVGAQPKTSSYVGESGEVKEKNVK
jgi:hypothetical protein